MSAPRSSLGLGSLIVAVVIVLAVGVGTVYAAIPNGNGTYRACLAKDTGNVRLINFPKVNTCPKGERLISWNAKGPQGPAGTQGPGGPEGAQGPQGPKGDQGPADWNAIPNIPADFKDGVDNAGVTSVKLTRVLGRTYFIGGGGTFITAASTPCPAGSKVTGGGAQTQNWLLRITMSYPDSAGSWWVQVVNTGANEGWMTPYAICMSVEPAGAFTTAKKGFLPAKVKIAMKKRSR